MLFYVVICSLTCSALTLAVNIAVPYIYDYEGVWYIYCSEVYGFIYGEDR